MMMIMKMVAVYITFNFLYILRHLIFMLYFTNHFLHADILTLIVVFIEVINSLKLSHTCSFAIKQIQIHFSIFIKMLKVGKVISSTTSRASVSWKQSYNNTTRGRVEQLEGHCSITYSTAA